MKMICFSRCTIAYHVSMIIHACMYTRNDFVGGVFIYIYICISGTVYYTTYCLYLCYFFCVCHPICFSIIANYISLLASLLLGDPVSYIVPTG